MDLKRWRWGLPLVLLALVDLQSWVLPARGEVIYQAFDDPYTELEKQLPQIQAWGYTHVQVSPPQKSHPADAWWANYQPIDFTVLDNRLGNEPDLVSLIERAHELDLKILVDVVLNHMANVSPYIDTLEYPQFSAIHFHPRQCIDYSIRPQVLVGWVGCDLPDLRTRSPYVRQQAKQFLQKLLDLGADGFRFDSAKHIEPDFFAEMLTVIPPDRYLYGEIIGETLEESLEYTDLFPVTDYHLYGTLVETFNPGGDLRTLINPARRRRALPEAVSVTFARNHDIVKNEDFFTFADPEDARLANAYILAVGMGQPFIFDEDAQDPMTQAGVRFHLQMQGEPLSYPAVEHLIPEVDPRDVLIIQRGEGGVALIYKGETAVQVSLEPLALGPGLYRELISGQSLDVGNGEPLTRSLLPNSAQFLVKEINANFSDVKETGRFGR